VASDLALPLDALTTTLAIVGKRGVGKTTTSAVLTEEMLEARLPVVVLDPLDAWFGLWATAAVRPVRPSAPAGGPPGLSFARTSSASVDDGRCARERPAIREESLDRGGTRAIGSCGPSGSLGSERGLWDERRPEGRRGLGVPN
jgi:DNA helicase HerA-like ATPase